MLSALREPDDAAVWHLDGDRALVVTTDFFTPIVDSPYDYGAIAAANSLSDVYAMGGRPFLALNIAAFPLQLPAEMLGEILRGGAEKSREAGVVIAGGHTIQDKEPKYGLVVLGFVNPQKIMTKSGARPGDLLALTKSIGSGVVTSAIKAGKAETAHEAEAVRRMKTLNAMACELALTAGVRSVTYITGFGLLGHAWEMAAASSDSFHFDFHKIPLLPGVVDYAAQWIFPGGGFDNAEYYSPSVDFGPEITQEMQLVCFDPQTSGGLLMAIPAEKQQTFEEKAQSLDQPYWWIGEVKEGERIMVA